MGAIPKIEVIDRLALQKGACHIGDRKMAVNPGNWAFFVPEDGLKLHHAVDGRQHCLHRTARPFVAPTLTDRISLTIGAAFGHWRGPYSADEWRAALTKPVELRAAETFIAAERLWNAGLGPRPHSVVVVRRFATDYAAHPTHTAGLRTEDATKLPPRADVTEAEMLSAGVAPDRIRSCTRQQINGYVTDLNSVVGVMPVQAGGEMQALAGEVQKALG